MFLLLSLALGFSSFIGPTSSCFTQPFMRKDLMLYLLIWGYYILIKLKFILDHVFTILVMFFLLKYDIILQMSSCGQLDKWMRHHYINESQHFIIK